MSKHKSTRRKIYVAEFSGLVLESILVAKCKDKVEMIGKVKQKLAEMGKLGDNCYYDIREVKHSENEIFFFNGEY